MLSFSHKLLLELAEVLRVPYHHLFTVELKERVLKLVQEYYRERGSPPSMRHIARTLRVSTKTLYRAFPGGIKQIYELAGVPRVAVGAGARVSKSVAEFFRLYREFLSEEYPEKPVESLGSLEAFINSVKAFVERRLGQQAVRRLEELPLSNFNKIAKVYLESRGKRKVKPA